MILWWGFRGIPPAQMNSMVPGTHMGRLLCPKTPLKNKFYANSPKSRKLVQAPRTETLINSLGPQPEDREAEKFYCFCEYPKSNTDIFWKRGLKKSDTFLNTSTTTKPRDIHIQVRRTLLY